MPKYHQCSNVYNMLKHPEKYVGKEKIITVRSSWESFFIFNFLDINKQVLEWSSEDVVIPYRYSLDNKIHRYFTDFYMKVKENEDIIKEYIIEIKPFDQTKPPQKPKKQTKSYNKRLCEYVKNLDKWKAAKSFCEKINHEQDRNLSFRIITEKDLYGK